MEDDERHHALQRLHILDAMWVACERRAELINLVGACTSAEEAVGQIAQTFGLDDVQARAILDLQIRRLAQLERSRIADEREALRRTAGLE